MKFILLLIGCVIGFGLDYIANNWVFKEKSKKFLWLEEVIVSLVMGFLSLCCYSFLGFSYSFFSLVVILALTVLIFISDIKYFIILDIPLVFFFVLLFVIKWCYFGFGNCLVSLGYGFLLALFIYFCSYVGKKIFKKDTLGDGDVKLTFLIGFVLGLPLGLTSLALSSFLALPYAVFSVLSNYNHEVAYGPFLSSSLLIVFLFADKFKSFLDFLFMVGLVNL